MKVAVQALQDKYMQGMQYTLSVEVVLKEQYGTLEVRTIQSSRECEENETRKDNNGKGMENQPIDAVEERGGTLCRGDMELPSESAENPEDLLQGHGSARAKSTYREVVINDKNMKQVGH